jgi:predicted ATPase/class 3 adenylate cyclase
VTDLPTGTVTFLFTDIEGSTNLARALGSRWPQVLADHHHILRAAIRTHQGIELSTKGDSFFAVFASAVDAVACTAAAQSALAQHSWPEEAQVRVRMGVHTGEGSVDSDEYVGLDVHLAARIAAAGHGVQVLLSHSTRSLVEQNLPDGVSLRDLGEHRLKDFDEAKHLHQLVIEGLPADFPPLKTLNVPTNLPVRLTSFVGRQRELGEITGLLESCRLVTLTGPGGTGKTRLALTAGSEVLDSFPDGVYFVELAPITDPQLVASEIGSTLGMGKEGHTPLMETLKSEIRDRTTLLILDNFEQVIDASPTVAELLRAASRLKILITSREPLRIAGEQEVPVPPLELPDVRRAQDRVDELRAVDSVALFLQRARSVRPAFDLTPANAAAVAELCARLDGLPLALELAAARTRLFEPRELLARLDRSLSFLGGGRDVDERQRTLRGAIDWSYDLLSEPEQLVFRRLSVFAGGCTLEAIEAVCLPDELGLDPLEVVFSLHDKSLLRRDEPSHAGLRVAMLETIRQYALEQLEASGEAPDLRRRHAEFFLQVAERQAVSPSGHDQQQWFDTLDRDLDNLRAAIRWAIDSGEVEKGLRLTASLSRFWLFRNHVKEGRRHLEQLLALPTPAESRAARAAALGSGADLASFQGDYGASAPMAEQALALYRELGDDAGIAQQLSSIGWSTILPDPAGAIELFRESIEAYRRSVGLTDIGEALFGMALAEMRMGNLSKAERLLDEGIALYQKASDENMFLIGVGLRGVCARLGGDLDAARQRYVDVLVRSERNGSHMGLTMGLITLADLALLEGDLERAAVLKAAEEQLSEQLGGTPPFELMGIQDVAARARAELGTELYEAASARGRAAPLEEIVRLALSGTGTKATPGTA